MAAKFQATQAVKIALIAFFLLNFSAVAEESRGGTRFSIEGASLHLSCNRGVRDLTKHKLECFGNVYARRPTELLTADYASLDLDTNIMHTEGNVAYFTTDIVMYGAKADVNFNTETGMLYDGKIANDRFELVGSKIQKLSSEYFKAIDAEYTTCRDCPASWKFKGHRVRLRLNDYAYLTSDIVKINDAPTLYLPYLIIPTKKDRQTGLLMPLTGYSQQDGFTLIEPFFWAISRSQDATLGLGFYNKKGLKGQGEYRFIAAPRTHGQLNSFYLHDKTFEEEFQDRWALEYSHNIELPWQIDQKLHWLDASDRDYARRYPQDIPGATEPALVSDAAISKSTPYLSVWADAKRIRNNLTPKLVGFDSDTVQLAPSVSVASKDHRILEGFPLYWGVYWNYSRFWRVSPSFDPLYPPGFTPPTSDFFYPGQTPLRRAQRFNVVPELYYATSLFDVLEVTPSAQYQYFHYMFDQPLADPLSRSYLITKTEVATTLEHVYGGRVKHKIRPSLTYSYIPMIQENGFHPFIQQIQTAGYQFDDTDIVPISTNFPLYLTPLGNSLTYSLGNKFILKSANEPYAYRKILDLTSGQTIDFIQLRKTPDQQRPFSRFFTIANFDLDALKGSGVYYFYPYINASSYSISLKYMMQKYHRRFLSFERSLAVQYNSDTVLSNTHTIGGQLNWSFNDYFASSYVINYQFPIGTPGGLLPGLITDIAFGLAYQSPSQCYQLVLTAEKKITFEGSGWSFAFNIPINLSGSGFMNLSQPQYGGIPNATPGGGLY